MKNVTPRTEFVSPDVVSRVLLGQELRRTREKASLTAIELGVCIGKSPGVIEAIESGLIGATERHIRKVLGVCMRPELWMPTTMPPAPDSDVTIPPIPRLSALSI